MNPTPSTQLPATADEREGVELECVGKRPARVSFSIQCQVCGRFISYADIESGKATHVMVTPDSHVSYEEWETKCEKHTTK
jgi:hypothetical protein